MTPEPGQRDLHRLAVDRPEGAAAGAVAAIATGNLHVLALRNDGSLRVWGNNEYGQLGLGHKLTKPVPVALPGLSGAAKGFAGGLGCVDSGRVNERDPVVVRYLCSELQCTECELASAVVHVGEHVAEVRQFLSLRNGSRRSPTAGSMVN